ncbi:MAG TPA: riboflavin synthase [Syntrophobacteraceae bacterium]|nr:riboflavin synthase [Syntrophobacteraceae bacterium]
MFTGLIEGTGLLLRMDRRGADAQMVLRASFPMERLALGESISVDGACLTVASFQGDVFAADVSAETLRRTTLGRKTSGSRVNLERALRLGDRLGGHLVSGHVDGIGVLKERRPEGRSLKLSFEIPPDLSVYVVEKGSIAVNGISLTVNACSPGRFEVNIIPHTSGETTLGEIRVGEEVNIETDLIGKYVAKMLDSWLNSSRKTEKPGRIDPSFLQKHGFL